MRARWAVLCLLFVTPSGRVVAQREAARDAGHSLREAHDAVEALEHARMLHLPRGDGEPGAAHPCPTRIGGMCHWPEGENAPGPPPEDPAVVAARARALGLVDSASHQVRGNTWLEGQRVQLAIASGGTSQAIAAARGCASSAAWCAELAGYALDEAADYAGADSAFAVALGAMSPADRCRWEDLSPLLQGALAKRYADADCNARERLALRVWWLSAPLYLVGDADARTDLYSRLVRARIADLEPSGEPFGWNDDVRALAVRYGWPVWYSQDLPAPGAILAPAVVGHERGGAYYFFPDARAVDSLALVDRTDWQLDDPHAPAAYAPPYAKSLHEIPAQITRFRGTADSMIVVAAWDGRADSTLRGSDFRAGLFVGTAPDSVRSVVRTDARSRGALWLTTPERAALVSVELLNDSTRRAGRSRQGIRPLSAASFGLSDLLLFEAEPSALPSRLEDAAPRALAAAVDAPQVGLFWELYSPPDSAHVVDMRLSIEPVRESWLGRVAAQLHMRATSSALALHWQERAGATRSTPRSIRLDLSGLRRGLYRVELTANEAGFGRQASASRVFFLAGGV